MPDGNALHVADMHSCRSHAKRHPWPLTVEVLHDGAVHVRVVALLITVRNLALLACRQRRCLHRPCQRQCLSTCLQLPRLSTSTDATQCIPATQSRNSGSSWRLIAVVKTASLHAHCEEHSLALLASHGCSTTHLELLHAELSVFHGVVLLVAAVHPDLPPAQVARVDGRAVVLAAASLSNARPPALQLLQVQPWVTQAMTSAASVQGPCHQTLCMRWPPLCASSCNWGLCQLTFLEPLCRHTIAYAWPSAPSSLMVHTVVGSPLCVCSHKPGHRACMQ